MSKFYERYWQNKDDGHLGDFELKWPKLRKFIPQDNQAVILDFGCGTGLVLREISKINPKAELMGLDVSDSAIGQAKKNLPGAKLYKIIDGGEIPLADNSTDFVFSSEVIEHIYDTENAVSELARIIKPGGRLLLTTPYHGLIKNILVVLFAFDNHFNPVGPHVRFFTKKSLFNLLEKHGFKIISYGYYGRFYPVSHSIFVLAQK